MPLVPTFSVIQLSLAQPDRLLRDLRVSAVNPMPNQLTQLYRFTLASLETLLDEVTEEQMSHLPSPGINPPGWIVGHLVMVNDFALKLLGKEPLLTGERAAAWGKEFGPGSTAEPIADAYPPKAELMAALREGYAAVAEAAEGVDLATLTAPNPVAALAGKLPTAGDLVGHILTTHPGMHIGQLQNWRRQVGFKPLF